MSSLSEKEHIVFDILNDPADVKTCARDHGVSESTVRNIKMLKTRIAKRVHRWMDENHFSSYLLTAQRRFTSEQVQAIRASQKTSAQLAKLFECSPSTIRMIKTGKTYG